MGKLKKIIMITIVLCLLLGIGAAVFGFLLPYYQAETRMREGDFLIEAQADGQLLLSWPEAENADYYRLEILQIGNAGEGKKLVYREFPETESGFLLPELPGGMPLTLQVTSVVKYRTLLEEGLRYSENMLEITTQFDIPSIQNLESGADVGENTFCLDVQTEDFWYSQLLDGSGNVLDARDVEGNSLALQFGDTGMKLPEEGEAYQLRILPLRMEPGLRFLGVAYAELPITREALTEWDLDPVLTKNSKNTITLTWGENHGLAYEVQQMDGKSNTWTTVAEIGAGEERSYQSDWLEPEQVYQFRVVSLDPDKGGEYAAVSDPLIFETLPMTKYATVWPVRDLAAYGDAAWGNVVGTAKQGQAYCVLEEKNNMFAVDIDGQICYIDSNYCMINLPEYIGELCNYNITNSVYAIYAVHEFAIPRVTGVVTGGYEDVYQEDGSFLVPLLYPTAKKLLNAVNTAREQGYRLKIYDSFRPYRATREIYDLTELILNDPLPEKTYTGIDRDTLDLPEPRYGASELTFGWLMTGRFYVLNAFLARTGSTHNLGIALDLTLEDLETGEEIPMQSSIHDLSHYSVLSENNEAADVLGSIMHGAGFGGLSSEWWHFQDDNSRAKLALTSVPNGVSAECWVRDQTGWRYRTAKGAFYESETVEIDGVSYTFDENGYTDYRTN